MRNKFPGFCFRCQVPVAKGQGHPEKVEREHFMLGFKSNFVIRCLSCVGKGIEILDPKRTNQKKACKKQ